MSQLAAALPAIATAALTGVASGQPAEVPWDAYPQQDIELEDEPVVRNGFSAKLEVGPSYYNVFGHSVLGGGGAIAVGAQFGEAGALHGQVMLFGGLTDGGLTTFMVSFGPTWEFIIDRFRPGLGFAIQHLSVEGPTTYLERLEPAGQLWLSIDLVQHPHANLFVAARGEISPVDDEAMAGLWLSVGARFKVP